MPYNVGFLNQVEDTETYNVSVYDELQKVSSASTHMFEAIDSIHASIDERMVALDALNLSFNDKLNQVTVNFSGRLGDLETDVANINIKLGNLTIEDISGLASSIDGINESIIQTNRTLNGTIQDLTDFQTSTNTKIVGIQTQVDSNLGDITTLQAAITNVEVDVYDRDASGNIIKVWGKAAYADSVTLRTDVTVLQQDIQTITQQINDPTGSNGIIQQLNLITTTLIPNVDGKATAAQNTADQVSTEYAAQWSVKTSIGQLQNGIGIFNNGTSTGAWIDAQTFTVYDSSTGQIGDAPFSVNGGKTYIKNVEIAAGSITNVMLADSAITGSKIEDSTITSSKLVDGFIESAIVDSTLNSVDYPTNGISVDFKNNKLIMNSSTTNGRVLLDDYGLTVYDGNGAMRVHLGRRRS